MSHITKDDILDSLSHIEDPIVKKDIVTLGLVSSVIIKEGKVGLALECKEGEHETYELVRKECEAHILKIPGIKEVTVVLTAHNNSTPHINTKSKAKSNAAKPEIRPILYVKKIIAVGSGKGGVGKSTIAANIALALKKDGLSVGLADADIYGPSIPKLFNRKQEPLISDEKQMFPIEVQGIKTMSMGYLLPDDTATIWRGSMATKALHQILRATEWGKEDNPLDILVVDLPPGTGDIHLTLCQQYPLDGAIIVSTPQELSLLDARKAINMFKKVGVPIKGIIENMSYFQDPNSEEKHYLFGESTMASFAKQANVPLLAHIPIDSSTAILQGDMEPFSEVSKSIMQD